MVENYLADIDQVIFRYLVAIHSEERGRGGEVHSLSLLAYADRS